MQPLTLLITRFCLKGCSTRLAFPEYPCNGLRHTCTIEVKVLQFREHYLGFFISNVAFPKVPASIHCSTSSMHQSCSTSLSDILLTCTATLTILSYQSFRPPDGLSSQTDAIQAMERCVEDIRHWMVSDHLLLNDEKMEFLLIGTRQQLSKVEPLP